MNKKAPPHIALEEFGDLGLSHAPPTVGLSDDRGAAMPKRSFFYELDAELYTWFIDPPPGPLVRFIRRFFAWLHKRGRRDA